MNCSMLALVLTLLVVHFSAGADPAGNSTCSKDTGGTCRFLGCKPWRNANCVSSVCVCAGEDVCAFQGRCNTPADTLATTRQDKATQALADLMALPQMEAAAKKWIEAQEKSANDAISDTKAAADEAAAEVAAKKASTALEKDLENAKQAQKNAVAALADATTCLKSSQDQSKCAFGKAQSDKASADKLVETVTQNQYESQKKALTAKHSHEDHLNKAAQEKNLSTSCEEDTGGTCNVLGCHAFRNAVCEGVGIDIENKKVGKKICVCAPGTCAFEGVCVPNDSSLGPLDAQKRIDFARKLYEEKLAADQAALKANDDAPCEKDTGHGCNLGQCVLYDAWGTATCVNGTCQCSEENACVLQGVCTHKVTSADIPANYSYVVKMASENASPLPLGFVTLAAVCTGILISAGFIVADQRQKRECTQPLLAQAA